MAINMPAFVLALLFLLFKKVILLKLLLLLFLLQLSLLYHIHCQQVLLEVCLRASDLACRI